MSQEWGYFFHYKFYQVTSMVVNGRQQQHKANRINLVLFFALAN